MELKFADPPYGGAGNEKLLIEPYGIEIDLAAVSDITSVAFNRTLWN